MKITLDWASRLNARLRLLISTVVAAIAYWLPVPKMQALTHTLVAWEAGVFCFLLLAWVIIVSTDPDGVRRNAQGQDESATAIFVLVICAACASLFAVALLLAGSEPGRGGLLGVDVALTVFSVFESWLLVHTAFALHYAHGYYRNPAGVDALGDGLDFPGEKRPDYLDFAYFSFVIGMTSQVSDVAITSRSIRRLALIHGLISFVFNTIILASSVNVVAGLLG